MSRARFPTLYDPRHRQRGLAHLRRADPVLGHEVRRQGDIWPARTVSYFELLCQVIVDQQLSVKAGRTIFGRWQASLDGLVRPERALAQPESAMRACGISGAKGRAIRAVAAAEVDGTLRLRGLSRLDDSTVTERLLAIKGIGPWSAEMFLIFGLGRPDIFSVGDLGLRNAMKLLLEGEGISPRSLDRESAWTKRAERWSPYRSLASLYLWRLLDAG